MDDVITIGTATRDVYLQSDALKVLRDKRFPTGLAQAVSLGSKVEVDDITFTTGGGGTNAATTFARQGFRTAVIAQVGKDIRGDEVIRTMREEHVRTKHLRQSRDGSSAYAVILVNTGGRRTIFVHRGVGAELKPTHVQWSRVRGRWMYLSSLGGNVALLRKAIRHARAQRMKIAINPGSKELALSPRTLHPLLRQVDVLIVNREEAADLTDIPFSKRAQVDRAMDRLTPALTIITEGIKGATAFADGKQYRSATHRSKPRREVTGAGDAFGSGLVASLIRQPKDVALAMQSGTANAESVVQYVGPKKGDPSSNAAEARAGASDRIVIRELTRQGSPGTLGTPC